MKKGFILLLGYLFLHGYPLYAQKGNKNRGGRVAETEEKNTLVPDTVSVKELKGKFDDWVTGRKRLASYMAHQIMGHDEPLLYEWDSDEGRRLFNLTTRHPKRLWVDGKDSIPWGYWQIGKLQEGKNAKTGLYWHHWSYPYPGTDTTVLQKKMEERYGYVRGYGVPARWINDTLCFTAHSRLYCNTRICNYAKLQEVKQGELTDGAVLRVRHGSLSEEQSDFNRRMTKGTYRYEEHYGHTELYLLSRDLGAMPVKDDYNGRTAFSFLVYVNPDGKACLHTLLPKQLTAEEEVLTNALKTSFDRQPKGIFGYMVTIDGRIFPARYLKGIYHPANRRWAFTDHLFSQWNEYFRIKVSQ